MNSTYSGFLIGFVFIFLTACAGHDVEFSKENTQTIKSVNPTITPAPTVCTTTGTNTLPMNPEGQTIGEVLGEKLEIVRYPYLDHCIVDGEIVHFKGFMDVDYHTQTASMNVEQFEKFCGPANDVIKNYTLALGEYYLGDRFFEHMKNLIEEFELTNISKEERRSKSVENADYVINWYNTERPERATWDSLDTYTYNFAQSTKFTMNNVCAPDYKVDYEALSQLEKIQADLSDREVIFMSKSNELTVSLTVLDQTTNYAFSGTSNCKDIIMPKRVFNEGVRGLEDSSMPISNFYNSAMQTAGDWRSLKGSKNFLCLVSGDGECAP